MARPSKVYGLLSWLRDQFQLNVVSRGYGKDWHICHSHACSASVESSASVENRSSLSCCVIYVLLCGCETTAKCFIRAAIWRILNFARSDFAHDSDVQTHFIVSRQSCVNAAWDHLVILPDFQTLFLSELFFCQPVIFPASYVWRRSQGRPSETWFHHIMNDQYDHKGFTLMIYSVYIF